MLKRPPTDVISELLGSMRLRSSVYASPTMCGRWRLNSQPHGAAVYHLVVRGTAWLHLPGDVPPRALRAGDLVVFPRDLEHSLSAEAELPRITEQQDTAGPTSELVCGRFDMAESAASLFFDSLPPVLVIDGEATIPGLTGLGRLVAAEADARGLGHQLVLDRLSDVLFVAILRYVVENGVVGRGLLAGLRDPGIARALSEMTANPGRDWTIAALAAHAGTSRTVFAERFLELVGEPPIAWLTMLRMNRGAVLLEDPRRSVADVAADLGYRTAAAFRRAFKRARGVGPGAVRRAAIKGART